VLCFDDGMFSGFVAIVPPSFLVMENAFLFQGLLLVIVGHDDFKL
jgi:hypothetical protein